MNTLIILLIIILLIVGAYFLFRDNSPETENGTLEEDNYTVSYTNTGFSPQTITVERGETVMFQNQSSGGMWVASAVHPIHAVYSGTTLNQHCPDDDNNDFDQCESGDTFRFTFNKSGTWNYHDHLNASNTGSVIVQ